MRISAKRLNQLIMLMALVTGVLYLVYRAIYTVNYNALWFWVLFYLAELHGLFEFSLFSFDVWEPQHPQSKPARPGLKVDVFICTYNEEPDLLRKTIMGAQAIDYPHTTYVLDDGRRDEVRDLAEALGIKYITRGDNFHAKAGNINNALKHTHGDFIAILDADHVPLPDFLDMMLGYFDDAKVGFVQSPQTFYNFDALEEDVDYQFGKQWEEAEIFFHLTMPGKNRWGSAYFCGTGGVFRRAALEEVGGFATETITEDIHTAMKVHSRGWKSVYVAQHLASGLAPCDLASYHTQRTRWAVGNLHVMFCCNPLTLPGLSWQQRISYLSSTFHWTCGLRKLVFYLSPILMLLFGIYPIAGFNSKFVLFYIIQLSMLLIAFKFVSRGRGSVIREECFSMMNFWIFTSSFIRACLKIKAGKFETTDKSGTSRFSFSSTRPQLILMAVSLVAITWGMLSLLYGTVPKPLGVYVGSFWCLWNAAFALWVILIATEPAKNEGQIRFADHIPLLYSRADSRQQVALSEEYGIDGMKAIFWEPIKEGSQFDATLILRFFRLPVKIEIVKECDHKIEHQSTYHYEVRFVEIDQTCIDMLNTHTMLYTAPRLLDYLSSNGKKMLYQDSLSWLLPRRHCRGRVDFPVTFDVEHNTWTHCRVESLNSEEATLFRETPLELEHEHPFAMVTTLGMVRGVAEVVSNTPISFHGDQVWQSKIRFKSIERDDEKIFRRFTDV